MATVISISEGELASPVEALIGGGEDYLGLPAQDDLTIIEILNAAWTAIEQRIPQRYIQRPFEALVRSDFDGELFRLPFFPVEITEASRFNETTGTFGPNEIPLLPGFEAGSIVLPAAAAWRLQGTAGPAVAENPPHAVVLAVRRLMAAGFVHRGDAGGELDLIYSGALEPIKSMIRL